MLIRTPDKRKFVNLNNITNIHLFTYKNKNEIRETYPTEIRYNMETENGTLGIYSSEEKAIKVLDMLQEEYLDANYFNHSGCVMNKVFVMPADSEVNV